MRLVTWHDNFILMQNNGEPRRFEDQNEGRFRFYELRVPDADYTVLYDQDPEGAFVTSTDDMRLNLAFSGRDAALRVSTRRYLPVLDGAGTIPEGSWYKVLAGTIATNAVGVVAKAATDITVTAAQKARLIGQENAIRAGLNLFFVEAPDIPVAAADVPATEGLLPNNIYKVASGIVFYGGEEYHTGEFIRTGETLEAAFGAGTDGIVYRYQPDPFFTDLSENVPLYEEAHFKQKVLGQGTEVKSYNINRLPPVTAHDSKTVFK